MLGLMFCLRAAAGRFELKVCVCVCVTGAVCCQSDASPEVHKPLEESSSAPTIHSAGLHEDTRESWTSAHIQAERRLDRTLQVDIHKQ